jgi:hypothetical protein
LGNWSTDQIEKRFFGAVDTHGRNAVELFGDYNGYIKGVHQAFPILPPYMDAQRFRTPRGLKSLRERTQSKDHNRTLIAMQELFQFHTTMWSEGVWEIARARQSRTKFIVTDEPVTFYNRRIYPDEAIDSGSIELDQVGTRTLFPLGLDACLIITHIQLVRNPRSNPNAIRANARAYETTMRDLLDFQFGRELDEDEVRRINFILKKRAARYIAAAEKDWLYPERHVSVTSWSQLDDDWFLLPHLYKIPFTSGIVAGYKDGSSWASDEYGRRPDHPKYKDEKLRDKEWRTSLRAQQEWAKKRLGKSVAHVHSGRGPDEDRFGDDSMQRYLEQEGLVPTSETPSPPR